MSFGISKLADTVEAIPGEVETDALSFAADALFIIFGLILIVFALYYAVAFNGNMNVGNLAVAAMS